MNKVFEKYFKHSIYQVFDEKPDIASLVEVDQVHGDIISIGTKKIKADGILFKTDEIKNNQLAIKTADCLPIIYSGPKSLAVIHAGWRGIEQGIHIHNDLKQEEFEHIFIGPSISAINFEVTEEFQSYFPNSDCFTIQNDKMTFNLQKYTLNQLRECFPLAIIEASGICTFENHKFNSYRRDATKKRNWNILKKKD